jgi:hypothetical protein
LQECDLTKKDKTFQKRDYNDMTLEEAGKAAYEDWLAMGKKVTVIPQGVRSESADPKKFWGGRPKKKPAEVNVPKR